MNPQARTGITAHQARGGKTVQAARSAGQQGKPGVSPQIARNNVSVVRINPGVRSLLNILKNTEKKRFN